MSNCKVITVAQQKGGAGKTTIAVHLAVALSQKRNRVAILDVDPQGSTSQWYKIREEKFGEDYTGLFCKSIAGWKLNSEILMLKREYDFIIIDSPPHTETDAKTAIRCADLLLVPVQPSPTDLWATKSTTELAQQEKIPFFIVFNRLNPNSKLANDIISQLENPMKAQIGNRVAFASSMMEGKCVTEVSPKSQASDEVKAMVNEVLNYFKKSEKKKAA